MGPKTGPTRRQQLGTANANPQPAPMPNTRGRSARKKCLRIIPMSSSDSTAARDRPAAGDASILDDVIEIELRDGQAGMIRHDLDPVADVELAVDVIRRFRADHAMLL